MRSLGLDEEDVESQAGGTQESSESPWFGGGGLDGVDQGSPRVAGVRIERERDRGPPKVVCLWVLIEWRRPGVSLME